MPVSNPDEKLVTLADGTEVPLGHAVRVLNHLQFYLQSQHGEWDEVYHLRRLCLGQNVEDVVIPHLIAAKWLELDGEVDPVVAAVVRSSVRGEDRLLRVDSPFTTVVDRAWGDFLVSRDFLLNELGPDEAATLFERPPLERVLDAARKRSDTAQPTDNEIKSFVDKVRSRLDLDNDDPMSSPSPR